MAPDASVIQVLWHPRIKQVVCGMSSGAAKILYNPAFSSKGALLVSRSPIIHDATDTARPTSLLLISLTDRLLPRCLPACLLCRVRTV